MFFGFLWFNIFNTVFATGGLVLLMLTIGLYIDYFYMRSQYFIRWLQPYVWTVLLATTLGSVAITLLYSEYYGFVPCSLCWLQRIALYPQALFVLMAIRTKESVYFPLYSLGLSVFGLLVALYHYVYQMIPKGESTAGIMPCLADGTADCATKVIEEFGFMTFPLLSAITFTFLIVIYLNLRRTV